MMDFDQIISTSVSGNPIQIGCIRGAHKVLFIKTGQGGSIRGYEDKYIRLAYAIRQKYGYAVLVSATVSDKEAVFQKEMQIVDDFFENVPYEIYYLGVSKGGLIGCWYGAQYPQIKRMMVLNAPLMINFYNRTVPAIQKFAPHSLTMIYGSLDPSYRYLSFAEKYAQVKVIENADHNLRGMEHIFAELVEQLLQ